MGLYIVAVYGTLWYHLNRIRSCAVLPVLSAGSAAHDMTGTSPAAQPKTAEGSRHLKRLHLDQILKLADTSLDLEGS